MFERQEKWKQNFGWNNIREKTGADGGGHNNKSSAVRIDWFSSQWDLSS